MRVLVLGATGYLGSAITTRLAADGHEPIALVRNGSGAAAPGSAAATRTGDLNDPALLAEVITTDIDAVVHAATPTGDWDLDAAVIAAIRGKLSPQRPLLYLSGVWVLGATTDADESTPPAPLSIVSRRDEIERQVLATSDARGIVVRPGIAYGHNGGIPALMVGWARAHGAGRYVTAAAEPPVWPMIHVDDLAALIATALVAAPAGKLLHGISESGVSARALAAAADLAAGGHGTADPWPLDEAARELGAPFAEALSTSQIVHAPAAAELGWKPRESNAIETVAEYAATDR